MRYDWLRPKIEEVRFYVKEKRGWGFEADFHAPATDVDIGACEEALSFSLPPSYRDFALLTNGATFSILYPVMGMIVPGTHSFVNLAAMASRTQSFRKQCYHDWERFVYVGRHNEGDLILFDLHRLTDREYAILDSGSFPYTGLDVIAAPTFEHHLAAYLDGVIRWADDDASAYI